MKSPPFNEDLSVLSRRSEATPSELRRLGMLLDASPVERFLHELGQDCDRRTTETPEDSRLVARAIRRVLGTRLAATPRTRRSLVTGAAAAVCLVSLGAAASLLIPRGRSTAEAPVTPPQCTASVSVASVPARSAARAERPAASASAVVALHARPPASSPRRVRQAPPPSAAEQFARANALRKSGQTDAALSAYSQLQRSHPDSPEAILSHVLLGRILLGRGSAAAAHRQFAQYVQARPGGTLVEEALHGEAEALRISGRMAEEREVRRTLLSRYPNSIYARSARARLRELE